jgi:probable rRNA maturation factor
MNENQAITTESPTDDLPEASGDPEPVRSDSSAALRISVADEQSRLAVDAAQLTAAVESVIAASDYDSGSVSLAVVDDPTIHQINRQYLDHDYPTDVLSFVLEDRLPYLEGELVVSTDTATQSAAEYGWDAQSELLLYVIHGALHLVGYRDKTPEEIAKMRAAEQLHLAALGVAPPEDLTRKSSPDKKSPDKNSTDENSTDENSTDGESPC